MSELTSCNFCTLRDMRKRARKRGVIVIVKHHRTGEWAGWVTATYSDQKAPAEYFVKLTTSCVC